MRRPAGILFDLDCTLTDRAASVARFARTFVAHFGRRLRCNGDARAVAARISEVDRNGYVPRAQCWPHLIERLDWAEAPSHGELDELWAGAWPGCAVGVAGVRGVLERLAAAGFALGIVTNGEVRSQEAKVDALGVRDLMRVVVVSETVGVAKPDGRVFEAARRGMGMEAGAIWFVGDHPVNDVAGARRAGMVDVWVRGHAPWPGSLARATVEVERVGEVLGAIEKFGKNSGNVRDVDGGGVV